MFDSDFHCITIKGHLTLVIMAIIKKSTNNKCLRGCGENVTILHYWWECKLVQPPWKLVWIFFKKLKVELPYDQPSHSFVYREYHNSKRYMHFQCYRSTIYSSQGMETTEMSIDRGINKEEVIHTHTGILLDHRKKKSYTSICNNMYRSRDSHIEWRKSDTERQISYVTSMWNLKKGCKWTYLQNRSRVTTIHKLHNNQNALCCPS